MIMKLPNWVLVNKFPAFFDTESLTATEQTARIYGKINELIESYNKYVEEINKTITEYESEKDADVQAFICRISTLTLNYINTVDMKIMHQDRKIAEVYDKFSADVINTLKILLSDLKESGELDFAILDAISNLNEKVDEFITECEEFKTSCIQFKEDMSADYQNTKTQLNADYEAKKTALEGDYNEVKTALDTDYNTTKENLSADYEETKTQLDSDYSAKKTALDTDYNTTKENLSADYEEKKTALTDSVAGYVGMYENKGKLIFQATGSEDTIKYGVLETPLEIPSLENYSLLIVASSNGYGVCMISQGADSFRIMGYALGVLSDNDLSSGHNIYLKGVIENGVYKITENKTTMVSHIKTTIDGSNTYSVTMQETYITFIKGII